MIAHKKRSKIKEKNFKKQK